MRECIPWLGTDSGKGVSSWGLSLYHSPFTLGQKLDLSWEFGKRNLATLYWMPESWGGWIACSGRINDRLSTLLRLLPTGLRGSSLY